MRDEDLEKIMERWADHEIASAPEMHPTADMYRMVRAKMRRNRFSVLFARRFAVAAAAAGLVVFLVFYTMIFQPDMRSGAPVGQKVALVEQREAFPAEKGVVVKGAVSPSGKSGRGGPAVFSQLMFQYQKQDSKSVEGIDLQLPQEEMVTLTQADNYRLLLEPVEDRYVYVFQITPSNILARLFPDEAYSAVQNPLQAGSRHYLPSEPNWFYLRGDVGEAHIYVVASPLPLRGLEDAYIHYTQMYDETQKQELLAQLVNTLETIRESRMFAFYHR
jgi:hypothetical protein